MIRYYVETNRFEILEIDLFSRNNNPRGIYLHNGNRSAWVVERFNSTYSGNFKTFLQSAKKWDKLHNCIYYFEIKNGKRIKIQDTIQIWEEKWDD